MSRIHRFERLTTRALQLLALGLAAAVLAGCERPPVVSTQNGYRGTGMEHTVNPRIVAQKVAMNRAPEIADAASPDGPKASAIYQNVKVLGNLSVGEFARNMVAITAWVAPKEEGCNYCHVGANFADDSKYTKVVARRMLEMTQKINAGWKQHVGDTGVTCYTCHRGQPVPTQVWYQPADRKYAANSVMGDLAGQNLASSSVGYSSLPFDPFTPYLKEDKPIRVIGDKALKFTGTAANLHTTKQAEHTYGLMVHMSNALGVNCTYCHNTRNFQGWNDAPPARTKAWHGIRMAREVNNDYLVPLTKAFPANRLGVHGDVAKVNCSTCHQGVNKPLYGAQMAKSYPELLAIYTAPAAAAVPTGGLPAAVDEAMRSIMYFAVGSPVLEGEQAKAMAKLTATMLATPALKARISGFHSASGDPASNQELAKQRAFTVRDSLLAAGIATDRVILDKPQETQANNAGEDALARRVEVKVEP
jgi:photosynthetic reaction center cytochrome c subunit